MIAVPDADARQQSPADHELVRQVVGATTDAQRQSAFDHIYTTHGDKVRSACAARLPDDWEAAEAAATETFTVAYRDLIEGRPPRNPDNLAAWLLGIARNRCREEFRRRKPTAALPDDLEADLYESASRGRLAEVDRILEIVAQSFTVPQRRLYELSTRRHLRGQALARELGVSETEANRRTYENKARLQQGFGAYVLAKDGRRHCPGLALILDEYAWTEAGFTKRLRSRILRHMADCKTCDDCGTCKTVKKQLIRPYVPVLFPLITAAYLQDRVHEGMQSVGASATLPSEGLPVHGSGAPAGPRRPPRSRFRGRRAVAGGAVIMAVLGGVATFAVLNAPNGASRQAVPLKDQEAASITRAMTGRKWVTFDVQARNLSDPAQFEGRGRIDMAAGRTTATATHVLYDPGEDPWNPPDVVVIQDRAYITQSGSTTTKTVPAAAADAARDLDVSNALQTRWLTSPENIALLLRDAERVGVKDASAGATITGTTPLRVLAANPAASFFYQPYLKTTASTAVVSFKIVIDRNNLPVRFTFDIPVHHTGYLAQFTKDPFVVAYRDWTKGKPITQPSQPPTPQWGSYPTGQGVPVKP
ncbi:RNA polymerase sigma factor [Streptomyces sp. NPDC101209]|uniref:RNA polymerase sigma factor n=1 Tax=Streptomyces sp. NPDC101209 TaxID=3366129 RepID=UPI00380F9369